MGTTGFCICDHVGYYDIGSELEPLPSACCATHCHLTGFCYQCVDIGQLYLSKIYIRPNAGVTCTKPNCYTFSAGGLGNVFQKKDPYSLGNAGIYYDKGSYTSGPSTGYPYLWRYSGVASVDAYIDPNWTFFYSQTEDIYTTTTNSIGYGYDGSTAVATANLSCGTSAALIAAYYDGSNYSFLGNCTELSTAISVLGYGVGAYQFNSGRGQWTSTETNASCVSAEFSAVWSDSFRKHWVTCLAVRAFYYY